MTRRGCYLPASPLLALTGAAAALFWLGRRLRP